MTGINRQKIVSSLGINKTEQDLKKTNPERKRKM